MSEDVLFLDRTAVRECAAAIDVCQVVTDALVRHARGAGTLPAEGHLPWTNDRGGSCRSLAMLGALEGDGAPPVRGIKLINAATSNPALGRERAAGVSLLFDHDTARPLVLAEAGWLSAARTAAYTMVSLRHLGPPGWQELTLIGCGTLARMHLELLGTAFPRVRTVHLYDMDPRRAGGLAHWNAQQRPELRTLVHATAREAVRASPVVVTATTTGAGYLPAAWLCPGTFVAHVSLADLLPDALLTAQALYVDDIGLVRDNPRRVLGALMREGRITAREPGPAGGRALDGTLGQVLIGEVAAKRPGAGHVVSNPFGMAVLDVALLAAVHEVAVRRASGRRLRLY
ncbi:MULTISPECIES: ornithine cyclodeaminase [unclassified Streptomyces]|uniref:ornithine cyclodeaminase n=1 Tax=unclassified Streptomyces TaxID=2593676 RepID=UPI0033D95E82